MRRVAVAVLVGVLAVACGGDAGDPAADAATAGFEPVHAGASGFAGGAPMPLDAGRLSVSKVADGAAFFARVEDPGTSSLEPGETHRFRLAEVTVPSLDDDECLAETSRDHLRGMVRGGLGVPFVLTEAADIADPDGIPVHVWSGSGVWVNGEVLARGYGEVRDDGGSRYELAVAARAFGEDDGSGLWNPTLCPPEGS